MSVIKIRAHIECDECGAQFSVGMDPSDKPNKDWSLWDMAEDAVRGSVEYEDKLWQYGLVSSVQDGKMLCKDCTEKADGKSDDVCWRANPMAERDEIDEQTERLLPCSCEDFSSQGRGLHRGSCATFRRPAVATALREAAKREAELRCELTNRCDNCGAKLYSGPPDCFRCGAPNCCP